MRAILLVAGAALMLSACGGGETEANELDTLEVNNLVVDGNGTMDGMANLDANATMGGDTQNAMNQDLMTNDADTNLANGL